MSRDLLPPTSTNRIEAVFEVPREAKLGLAWVWNDATERQDSDVVEIWVHEAGEKATLVDAVPFEMGDSELTVSADLSRWVGKKVLLRVATRVRPYSAIWHLAELTGRAVVAEKDAPDEAPVKRPPDVLVYLIDTLRADVVGTHGGSVPTPVLDRLAAQGTVYETAYSTSSWTRPSVASVFTGTSVATHSVDSEELALPEDVLTLAERFRLRGYQTIGIYANQHVSDVWHFDQGFEIYRSPPLPPQPSREELQDPQTIYDNIAGEAVHRLAGEVLRQDRDPQRPLFLYVHVVDPHMPYRPPRWLLDEERPALRINAHLMKSINQNGTTADVLRDLELSYHGAVAYADDELGRFLADLDHLISLDNTLITVVADHGEAFLEHGLVGHRSWIYEEQVRVPLILHGPGIGRGVRIAEPVSILDIPSTLLTLVDGKKVVDHALQGEPLPLDPGDVTVSRTVPIEHVQGMALRKEQWKLVYRAAQPSASLFDVVTDPLETRDLAPDEAAVSDEMSADVRTWKAECRELSSRPYPVDLDTVAQSVIDQLKALGYLQ